MAEISRKEFKEKMKRSTIFFGIENRDIYGSITKHMVLLDREKWAETVKLANVELDRAKAFKERHDEDHLKLAEIREHIKKFPNGTEEKYKLWEGWTNKDLLEKRLELLHDIREWFNELVSLFNE